MFYEPLVDAHGNQFMVMRQMPGMHLEVTVIPKIPGVAAFSVDAAALRTLAQTFTAAAEVAERAIRTKAR